MTAAYRSAGQVHRFRDTVGAWLGTGQTVYLSPAEARAMARALIKAARSVDRERFADSSGNTTPLGINGGWTTLARGPDGKALRPYQPG